MDSSVDAALGRVALVLRSIGAVWMVLLVAVYGWAGDLDEPDIAVYVTSLGVAWAILAWVTGWMRHPRRDRDWLLLATDLGVAVTVVLISAAVQEDVGYVGGYPFASLVVGLAAAGRRGVVAAAATLSVATLAALGIGGVNLGAFVVGQILLYVLGAAALVMGTEVLRSNERRARQAEAALVIAEERAATAAHLHDSVLQTLALMQRRADAPATVRTLARRQERELREWLFPDGDVPASTPTTATQTAEPDTVEPTEAAAEGSSAGSPRTGEAAVSLRTALEQAAEDVEERYDVAIRVVTLGRVGHLTVATDRRSPAGSVVMAAREAMVNAAKHAGIASVDVFAESAIMASSNGSAQAETAEELTVFVRDRGVGFDPEAVPEHRHGVRGSIVDRMSRAGGSATITSAPGTGTEVVLRLPLRTASEQEPT
ncbi:sensor histidine kinase [Euzebya tangerina]|uniref:sensor histidine kinase n=1 Tax=Euzebya tangerina TaxID=591198 RepID=UPI000E31DAEE|nr:ATP-binding protein [Euzebya tangerina]